MNILRFDSVGGASGNMVFATLLDFGIEAEEIQSALSSLEIDKFEIIKTAFSNDTFSGSQVAVNTDQHHGHHHHTPADITDIIQKSDLPDPVKDMSIRVYGRLAKAEAAVHGTTVDKIHFHEVGEARAIVNIIGSCTILNILEIDEVTVSPLHLGQGTVECQHGVIPVPAPATVELLKGHPVIQTDEMAELVTPTGAAMLMEWKSEINPETEMTITKGPANGFGHNNLKKRPNLLRATVFQA